MSDRMGESELAALFMETGQHHHKAYQASDGVDPEWALFYAGYLQARIWDRLGEVPTRSQLIHFVVEADRAFGATGKEYMEWPGFYAKLYIETLASS
jgi:NAD(P)H-hydrate epimerase